MDPTEPARIGRAQGCLAGQLAGDSLGSLVEFMSPEEIRRYYPGGVRDLADGGVWDILAGQPTDDSEMALALARTLVGRKGFDPEAIRAAYVEWYESGPFDAGNTISGALRGRLNPDSQANGGLMRVSPLGIFGTGHSVDQVMAWAEADAGLTHVHPVCRKASALFAAAAAHAIWTGDGPKAVYRRIADWADAPAVPPALREATLAAAKEPPADCCRQSGWVLIAWQNALWQLLHAENAEEGIIDTVGRGGDTDTNAAIAGALLGAVYGLEGIPERWVEALRRCRPEAGRPGVRRPRPRCYWPIDFQELAESLYRLGRQTRKTNLA